MAEDTHILPGFTWNVAVMDNLGDSPEWLLEHSLLSTSEDGFFAIPNTLFSLENPCIPVANLLVRARTLRKGEVIGIISNPAESLDKAMNLEDLQEKMQCTAHSSIIINTLHVSSNSQEQLLFDDETWGPKNTELPSDETYKAANLENLIDMGSLPDNLWEQVWNMLRKRVAAFGFDGRLGSYPARVHIHTQDGQQPIAVPMYGASPEKRLIIEKQLKTWFQQDIIKPSISPWSTPVVIVTQVNRLATRSRILTLREVLMKRHNVL